MKILRGDTPKIENNDDCRVLAPFVMTLFDGEADETEARRARAHLLICQTCANRWLDWNRASDLLRSASVPAPPPQLLWRVLMACRLAKTPQKTASQARQSATQTAPSASISAQIFARTTRAPQSATQSALSIPARSGSFHRATFAPPRSAFSLRKMPAFAMPALAIWMLILQRDSWLPAPVNLEAPRAAAPQNTRPANPARAAVSASPAPAVSLLAPPRMTAKSAPPLAAIVEVAPEAEARAETSRAARRETVPDAHIVRVLEANFVQQSGAAFAGDNRAATEDAQETGPETSAIPVTPRPIRAAAPARLSKLPNQNRAPRLRTTRWKNLSLPALTADVSTPQNARALPQENSTASEPQLLRVSVPSARAPQPARLLAENFDADDDRIDEMRSVVDDFRSSVGPDDTAPDATDAPNS